MIIRIGNQTPLSVGEISIIWYQAFFILLLEHQNLADHFRTNYSPVPKLSFFTHPL